MANRPAPPYCGDLSNISATSPAASSFPHGVIDAPDLADAMADFATLRQPVPTPQDARLPRLQADVAEMMRVLRAPDWFAVRFSTAFGHESPRFCEWLVSAWSDGFHVWYHGPHPAEGHGAVLPTPDEVLYLLTLDLAAGLAPGRDDVVAALLSRVRPDWAGRYLRDVARVHARQVMRRAAIGEADTNVGDRVADLASPWT